MTSLSWLSLFVMVKLSLKQLFLSNRDYNYQLSLQRYPSSFFAICLCMLFFLLLAHKKFEMHIDLLPKPTHHHWMEDSPYDDMLIVLPSWHATMAS